MTASNNSNHIQSFTVEKRSWRVYTPEKSLAILIHTSQLPRNQTELTRRKNTVHPVYTSALAPLSLSISQTQPIQAQSIPTPLLPHHPQPQVPLLPTRRLPSHIPLLAQIPKASLAAGIASPPRPSETATRRRHGLRAPGRRRRWGPSRGRRSGGLTGVGISGLDGGGGGAGGLCGDGAGEGRRGVR